MTTLIGVQCSNGAIFASDLKWEINKRDCLGRKIFHSKDLSFFVGIAGRYSSDGEDIVEGILNRKIDIYHHDFTNMSFLEDLDLLIGDNRGKSPKLFYLNNEFDIEQIGIAFMGTGQEYAQNNFFEELQKREHKSAYKKRQTFLDYTKDAILFAGQKDVCSDGLDYSVLMGRNRAFWNYQEKLD